MPIKTRTSVIRQVPGKYETVEIDLDDPRQNEVTVKVAASGLCHSDDHVATGDVPVGVHPYAGGHEGVSDTYRDLVDKYYRSLATPRKPE